MDPKNSKKFQHALHYIWEERKEIPCKDMDVDCLPDKNGDIPFGSYFMCHKYDRESGGCPFLPMMGKNYG